MLVLTLFFISGNFVSDSTTILEVCRIYVGGERRDEKRFTTACCGTLFTMLAGLWMYRWNLNVFRRNQENNVKSVFNYPDRVINLRQASRKIQKRDLS